MAMTDTKTMMPATVENLREILFNVEPPKRLVNRRSEMPLLVSPDGLELLGDNEAKWLCRHDEWAVKAVASHTQRRILQQASLAQKRLELLGRRLSGNGPQTGPCATA